MAEEKRKLSPEEIFITPLEAKAEVRGAFESEKEGPSEYLITWLNRKAYDAQRTKIARTYLLRVDNQLVGYLAVSSSPLGFDVPDAPRNKSKYPVQGLLLGRLFISDAFQGCGIGSIALKYTISIATNMNELIGCAGIVVDSDMNAVTFYENHGFIPIEEKGGTVQMFFKLP